MPTLALTLLAPVSGVVVPLGSVPDPVFARKLAGEGISIDPTSMELRAPCAGTVTHLHGAHHALTLATEGGLEVLLHLGLDTVELKGEGFLPQVAQGDRVHAGQVLIVFDPVLVGRRGRSLLTQMVLPNGEGLELLASADSLVEGGRDALLRVTLREPAGKLAEDTGEGGVLSPPMLLTLASGLHARPSALLAGTAKKFKSTIRIQRGGEEVNAKSILAILGLDAKVGDALQVHASGPDARGAVAALVDLLASGCGEGGEAPRAAAPVLARPAPGGTGELAGVPAAPGLAVGRVFQYRPAVFEVIEAGRDPVQERTRLDAALREADGQIEGIKALIPLGADPARAEILSAHQELLVDPDLTGLAFERVAAGKSAGWAWREAFGAQAEQLAGLDSELLRERANDVRDVGRRVLALLADTAPAILTAPQDAILLAEELTPSETAQLDPSRVRGLCTTLGGPTSHVAILARSLGIPALCGIDQAALELADGTPVVLDGHRGLLRLNPGEADQRLALEQLGHQEERKSLEREAALRRAVTADGCFLEVAANVCNAREARDAVAAGAEGVGLLRTEFLFHDRDVPPSEAEQAAEYAAAAAVLGPGRRLVIRTLDVGGDKPLAYLPLPREDNPFLGMRGLRVSLERPALFRTQLRALLGACALGDLHVMFPMVSTLEEVRAAKAILAEENALLGAAVKIGVMIEVPSAALIAEALAREVDFFSIGTNDLTQYCLAMDRGHPKLAKQADALHPAVLKLIALTVAAAHRHGKWVGVCGGLASDPLALPALVGLGVDELSVDVPALGAIKARLATLDRTRCAQLSEELLLLGTAAEVQARLTAFVP